MTREELEHAITLLDDAVEHLAAMNSQACCELVDGWVLENMQDVIAKLERAYSYTESTTEEDTEEEDYY